MSVKIVLLFNIYSTNAKSKKCMNTCDCEFCSRQMQFSIKFVPERN
jgi:hypothetical protein